MKHIKKTAITGVMFVLITGTISHFVYDLSGQNILVGFFFPVNESTWEHMKLLFFPMLVYSFFITKKMKHANSCITSSLLLGTLTGTFLIPILFYTYSGILGYDVFVLDLLTFAVSVFGAFWTIYRATRSCEFETYEMQLKILVFLMTVFFFIFTYFPPDIGLFRVP